MTSVGIRELKNRLSSYLEEVKRGEVVLVTDRGTVVAEIRRPGEAALTPFERRLLPWVEAGAISRVAERNPAVYGPSGLHVADAVIADALDDSRDDW